MPLSHRPCARWRCGCTVLVVKDLLIGRSIKHSFDIILIHQNTNKQCSVPAVVQSCAFHLMFYSNLAAKTNRNGDTCKTSKHWGQCSEEVVFRDVLRGAVDLTQRYAMLIWEKADMWKQLRFGSKKELFFSLLDNCHFLQGHRPKQQTNINQHSICGEISILPGDLQTNATFPEGFNNRSKLWWF